MSTSFVLVGYDWKTTLDVAREICSVQKNASDDRVYYRLQMANKDDYALKKRLALSMITGITGDNIQPSSDYCTIFLYETEDMENSWFEGFGTSINHPELILNSLSSMLDTEWYSEHDSIYREISDSVNGDTDEITDEDLPI